MTYLTNDMDLLDEILRSSDEIGRNNSQGIHYFLY